MKTYTIIIKQIQIGLVSVEAKTLGDARRKGIDIINNKEFQLKNIDFQKEEVKIGKIIKKTNNHPE